MRSRPARGSGRAAPAGCVSRSPSTTTRSTSGRPARALAGGCARVKIGIVVPSRGRTGAASWSTPRTSGGRAAERGHDVKILMGNDPPGYLTRLLHPALGPARRAARRDHRRRPFGGRARKRVAAEHRALAALRHAHPPRVARRAVRSHSPARADDARDLRGRPLVCRAARSSPPGTPHGELEWLRAGRHFWGFLIDRVDARIAVRPWRRSRRRAGIPASTGSIPNGVLIPESGRAGGRENHVVFIGRHDPRKGLPTLLRGVARHPPPRPGRGCG